MRTKSIISQTVAQGAKAFQRLVEPKPNDRQAVFPPVVDGDPAKDLAISQPASCKPAHEAPLALTSGAPPLASGSIMERLKPFLKPGVDPGTHYVQFSVRWWSQIHVNVTDKPDRDLSDPRAFAGLVEVMVADLSSAAPAGWSPQQIDAYLQSAREHAHQIACNFPAQHNRVTLSDMYGICKQLKAVAGKSPAEIDGATLALRYGVTRAEKSGRISNCFAMLTGGLALERQMPWLEPAEGAELDVGPAELERFLCSMGDIERHFESADALLRAIHDVPSLSDIVLRHANEMLENLGDVSGPLTDNVADIKAAATVLILSLPFDVLQQLLYTRDEVEAMKSRALHVLGMCGGLINKDQFVPTMTSVADAGGEKALKQLLAGQAHEFNRTHDDDPVATRFILALKILSHNADRVDELRVQCAVDPSILTGEPTHVVLDRVVPPRFEHVMFEGQEACRLHGPTLGQARLALIDESPDASDEEPPAPRAMSPAAAAVRVDAPARPTPRRERREPESKSRPSGTRPRAPENKTAPAERPAPRAEEPAPYLGTRHPGSRPEGGEEHWHPRNNRRLRKSDVKANRLKLKAYQKLGKLFRFGEATPELGQALNESWRAHTGRSRAS